VKQTPGVPRCAIGRNVKDLPDLIQEHSDMVRQLEGHLAKYLKDPDHLPSARPTCSPSKKDKAYMKGQKVDAIEYLTGRISELEANIKHVRESLDQRNPMSYGFASYDDIAEAHCIAYSSRNKHPEGANIRLAPRPNDIIWENLAMSKATRRWKKITNSLWVSLLTIIWIVPNAMIAIFLTNLANLGRVWHGFQVSLSAHTTWWSIVQGVASPAVTSLVYLVLPIIFRRLSIRAGDITKTSRERHVVHQLYAFFVFNNLIIFTFFGTVWQFAADIVSANQKHENIWKAIREEQFRVAVIIALCNISPFWVTWLLQRNLGAAVDLVQLWSLVYNAVMKRIAHPTPRQLIEWSAPPPFDYASYYNYVSIALYLRDDSQLTRTKFLFYATVALCFATFQPLVLPVTAVYFILDNWLKKYLLL
jgi:hypothetical protein